MFLSWCGDSYHGLRPGMAESGLTDGSVHAVLRTAAGQTAGVKREGLFPPSQVCVLVAQPPLGSRHSGLWSQEAQERSWTRSVCIATVEMSSPTVASPRVTCGVFHFAGLLLQGYPDASIMPVAAASLCQLVLWPLSPSADWSLCPLSLCHFLEALSVDPSVMFFLTSPAPAACT